MNFQRSEKSIRFSTRLDEVRIEKSGEAIKLHLDGADREAIYAFSPVICEAIASEIGVAASDEFFDFVEAAIAAKKAEELVSAIIQKSTTEFFWMDMDQIDRFLVGNEKPEPLDAN